MPYGYIGQNLPNQTKSNSGVFSISDVADLEKQGKFGGSLELIEEQNYSSDVAFVDFTSIQETKYDVHFLSIENCGVSTDNRRLTCRLYESGVLETASVYQIATQTGTGAGSFVEVKSTGIDEMRLCDNAGNATSEKVNSYAYFYNLGNSSKYSFMTFHSVVSNPAGSVSMEFGGGVLPQASTVDGIRVLRNDDGNFNSFTMKLYGVKQL